LLMVLRKIQTGNSVSGEVVQEYSAERYRPLFRLLDESDSDFIRAGLPEQSRKLRRFRAGRRSLFRVYLRDLGADHSRIVGAIRQLLVDSQVDRPDLAIALYRCQFMFRLAMASIEFKLLCHAMGIGTVDVRSLVVAVEGLQLQFQDMLFVRSVGQAA
jgi:hypothetical protein